MMSISSTRTPNLVIINYCLSGNAKVHFCGQTSEHISETESEENLELSQNKAQDESATWC